MSNETMTLTQANREWASRPADERMPDLETLHAKAVEQRKAAVEKDVDFATLRVEAKDQNLYLTRGPLPTKLSNWAFTQLCGRVGAPSEYVAGLPATLAAQNLNHGLAKRVGEATGSAIARVLFHKNGEWIIRALTTDTYERIWNCELTERLLERQGEGWEPARPDFRLAGDDFPALYHGDRNMFAMVRLRTDYIEQPFGHGLPPIYKGFICWNSEVGDRTLGCMSFNYNGMCGNHLIWGAQNVFEVNVRHVGKVRETLDAFAVRMREYARASMSDDAATIRRATHKLIAATKEEVLDVLFGRRNLKLTRKVLDAGYDAVVPEQDGSPNTVWGMVQGLTRYSQSLGNADARVEVDKAAGRILDSLDSF